MVDRPTDARRADGPGAGPRARPAELDRRRRRRPVDLRVPRGDDPEHPRVRGRLPGRADHQLEQNYRSTQNILSAANAVITRNPGRKPKRLWTDSGAGAQIVAYVADTEHEEARFVAEEIDRLGDSDERAPGRRRDLLPRQRAVPRAGGGARSASACRTRSSAARGSTSARRSRTPSRTCARSTTRTTT